MPANSSRDTVVRQWELLKLLPSHGTGKSADDLAKALNAAGFQVSKRQVERDLNALSESFPLECNDKGTPYGWRWMEGASSDLPGITLADALSLHVVEDTLRPLLPAAVLKAVAPRFRQATKKLAAHADNNRTAHWADKVRTVVPTLPLLPPEVHAEILETVQEALLAGEQLEVEYHALRRTTPTTLPLNPMGLVQRGPVSYLIATAFDYSEPRLFAVHRIASAKRLYRPAPTRRDFDLDKYIETGALQFGNGEKISLEARVQESLARILEETPLSTDQIMVPEGRGTRVVATVADSLQLRWWVMSQGAAIEVLAPVGLRNTIAAKLAEAAAMYQIDPA